MPNEQYLDTSGLNAFWSQVKLYSDANVNPTWVGYTSDQWQMTGDMIDVLFQLDLDKCSTTPKTGSYGMVIADGGNDAQGNDTSSYMMICKAESPPNPDSAIDGQQWVRVVYALKADGDNSGGTADLAPGILLYASVAEPIQKNHTTTMTKSGFIGPLPNVNDAGYGLLTYDKKLYQVAYHISSIDSNGLYTIVYDEDPLLIGPSESSSSSQAFLVRAPIGTIVIWSGTADNIPTGWQLCDGTNGTPDLRDKFVLGAGTSHMVGSKGGTETTYLQQKHLPDHTHELPFVIEDLAGRDTGWAVGVDSKGTNIQEAKILLATSSVGNNEGFTNMPPHYTLCYIMKLTAEPTDGVTQEELTTALSEKQDTLTDGIGTTILNNAVNIDVPVQQIVTQAEFDALPEDDQNKGLWVISDGASGGGSGGNGLPSGGLTDQILQKKTDADYDVRWANMPEPGMTSNEVTEAIQTAFNNQLTEYDATGGWHVRKWANGYLEMSLKDARTLDITRAYESIYIPPVGKQYSFTYPLTLTTLYSEDIHVVSSNDNLVFFLSCAGGSLTKSSLIYPSAAKSWSNQSVVTTIRVTGKWK